MDYLCGPNVITGSVKNGRGEAGVQGDEMMEADATALGRLTLKTEEGATRREIKATSRNCKTRKWTFLLSLRKGH